MRSGWMISDRTFAFMVLILVLLALALRLWGIDVRGVTHPEIYVPGIPLPENISEPPPRHDFRTALWWHYHFEPHPMGWYLAMLGWTELFGSSHMAIRLPAALLGAISVLIIALIGRLVWGREAGLVAAVLTTLHGFQLFQAQQARMYMPGMVLGLVATWLLIMLMSQNRRRPLIEIGYFLTIVAGAETIEFFWPLLAVHMLWVALVTPDFKWQQPRLSMAGSPRVMQVQTLAVMLSIPSLSHSLYQARGGATRPPSVDFVTEYLNFGFLFIRDHFSIPPVSLPLAAALALGALCIALTILGMFAQGAPNVGRNPCREDLPRWLPWTMAIGCTALVIWMGTIAHNRGQYLTIFGVSPLLALAIPTILAGVRSAVKTVLPKLDSNLARVAPAPVLFLFCASVMPLLLFIASFKVPVTAPRAFMVFTPYMILLVSAGLLHLGTWKRSAALAATAAVLAAFAISVPYSYQRQSSPRDYQGLAKALAPRLQANDMILVRWRRWDDTPIFYYLPNARYVVKDWREELDADPDARVWLITWPYEHFPHDSGPRHDALSGYKPVEKVEALRARAELFVRNTDG